MGSGDINLAGLCLTEAEWAALDPDSQSDLLAAVVEPSRGWDHDAYDSYEVSVRAQHAATPPRPRRFVRMQTKRVRFVALSQPLGA